ncbi:MAG: hypothetical protein K8S97_14540 [Anaerolineae bacterium]|nr:hypothetical protein [Anaerolineae bacterium]
MPTHTIHKRQPPRPIRSALWLILLFALLLTACAESAKPEDAVPPYLKALLSNDQDQLLKSVCPAWEAEAQRDLDAFSGITGELQNADCEKAGAADGYTLVTCTGTMVLDYNGELRDRPLEGQTYRVKQIDGDWKMCGYH